MQAALPAPKNTAMAQLQGTRRPLSRVQGLMVGTILGPLASTKRRPDFTVRSQSENDQSLKISEGKKPPVGR